MVQSPFVALYWSYSVDAGLHRLGCWRQRLNLALFSPEKVLPSSFCVLLFLWLGQELLLTAAYFLQFGFVLGSFSPPHPRSVDSKSCTWWFISLWLISFPLLPFLSLEAVFVFYHPSGWYQICCGNPGFIALKVLNWHSAQRRNSNEAITLTTTEIEDSHPWRALFKGIDQGRKDTN